MAQDFLPYLLAPPLPATPITAPAVTDRPQVAPLASALDLIVRRSSSASAMKEVCTTVEKAASFGRPMSLNAAAVSGPSMTAAMSLAIGA